MPVDVSAIRGAPLLSHRGDDGAGRQADLDGCVRQRGRAVAQLPDVVDAPGERAPVCRHRATGHVCGRHAQRECSTRQADGQRVVRLAAGHADAELALRVVTPRVDEAVARRRHAVVQAGRDGRGTRRGRQVRLHRRGRVGRVAHAELALVVVTPRVHGTGRRERERMRVAHRDRRRDDTARQVHQRRDVVVRRRAVTELAVVVDAPGVDGSVRRQGQAARGADRDRRDHGAGRELHLDRRRAVGVGAVAELAVRVRAPRVHGTIRKQRQAMHVTAGDLDDLRTKRQRSGHRHSARGRVAGAELAGVVDAPARRGARRARHRHATGETRRARVVDRRARVACRHAVRADG